MKNTDEIKVGSKIKFASTKDQSSYNEVLEVVEILPNDELKVKIEVGDFRDFAIIKRNSIILNLGIKF